jgi:hypothetical protein
MGTEYDSHVVRQRRSARAFDDGAVMARIGLPNSTKNIGVQISLRNNPKNINIAVLGEHSNPIAVDELKDYMNSNVSSGAGGTLNLSLPLGFNEKRLELGLWHSSYLMMFHEFGYEFVFSALGEHMRKVLVAGADGAEPYFVHSMIPSGVDASWLVNSVSIATTPTFKCFAVCLPSPTSEHLGQCIHIPGYDPRSWPSHKAMVGKLLPMETHLQQISGNREIRLTRRAFRNYLEGCWYDLDVNGIIMAAIVGLICESDIQAELPLTKLADALNLELDHAEAVAKQLMSYGCLAGDLSEPKLGKVRFTEKMISTIKQNNPDRGREAE